MPDPAPVALPDTRPIPLGSLFGEQRALIERVNKHILAMADDAGRRPRAPASDPWASTDPGRTHRVLVLDGDRGVGKTSMLLTVLEGWRAAWTGDWGALDPEQRADRSGLDAVGPRVRAIQPVDFDPTPAELPLLCTVIAALRRVAERFDTCGDRALLREWQRLFQVATVGSSGAILRAKRDLVDGVLDLESQAVDWGGIPAAWRTFIDQLFTALRKDNPKVDLLVIPIDDADLQTDRVEEVLEVVRLLHHPRVAFIVTGHCAHAEDMGRLSALRDMLRGAAEVSDDALNYTPKHWAARIAQSRLEKAFALPNRLEVRGVPVAAAMAWPSPDAAWLRERLKVEAFEGPWRGALFPYQNAAELVERSPWLPQLPPIRVRSLTQRAAVSPPSEEPVEELFALLDDAEPGSLDGSLVRVIERAAEIRTGSDPRSTLVLGQGPRYTTRLPEDEKRSVDASPAELLRADMTAADGRSWDFVAGELFLWSVWHDGGAAGVFRWALPVVPRCPVELSNLRLRWEMMDPTSESTIQGVAYRWIFVLLWSIGVDDVHPSADPPGIKQWNALLDAIWERVRKANKAQEESGESAAGTFALNQVAHRIVPILAAPEYGMDATVRGLVLARTRAEVEQGPTSVDVWVSVLQNDRYSNAINAIAAYRSAHGRLAPAAWIGGPDPKSLSELNAERLLARIDAMADGLWDANVSMRKWLSESNPRLLPFFGAVRGVYLGETLPFSPFAAPMGSWMQRALDALCRAADLEGLSEELNAISLARGAGISAVALGLWRALVRAAGSRGVSKKLPALTGWLRMSDRSVSSSTMPRMIAQPRHETSPFLLTTTADGAVEENLAAVTPWEIPGFPSIPSPWRDGLCAALLLVQSMLADAGEPMPELSFQSWIIVLPQPKTSEPKEARTHLDPPRLAAWIDYDFLARRLRMIGDLVEELPAEIGREDQCDWQLLAILTALIDASKRDRSPPRFRYEQVTPDRRRLLLQSVNDRTSKDPVFKDWWSANVQHFARVLPSPDAS